MQKKGGFMFFWGKQDPVSNWHPAAFEYKGLRFAQTEQWMMYCKAKLFGDQAMADQILKETDPQKNKAQGRKVSGFDQAVWDEKAPGLVKIGVREKLIQNPSILAVVLDAGSARWAEASPFDKVWGTGLRVSDKDATVPEKWPGRNLLGDLITELSAEFQYSHSLPQRARAAIEAARKINLTRGLDGPSMDH
jgi:ribA/ribD-fused uncharacterized protein